MENGYKILWTENALYELKETIIYMEKNWNEKVIQKFANKLDNTLELISRNPELYPVSGRKKDVRRAVIMKVNCLYYRKKKHTIEILSFFSNRQNPESLNF
ncbi:type II toxin-antitoxin system RelE/ParE family toxin [Hyphobacterium sp. CCMP332]|nr:type II toxin-antitoxin system RelE/ParE family toxin [Hyphobacterium sp. CCMP332]